MKLKEKFKVIKLRKVGKSYGEILKEVNVSKGTLSVWFRDIKLTEAQKRRLYVTLRRKNAYKGAKIQQERKVERAEQIIAEAKKEAKHFLENPLFLSGLMLYWAEGDKSKIIERVKFSNSDPVMIALMMEWFRKICRVPEKKFRICLHIHELHCRKNIKRYWCKITKISSSQFHKTQIKPTSLKQRKNKLYNGTCSIIVFDKDLFRKIEGWKLGILEKFKV